MRWEAVLPVTPMGKPRMTRRDKWAKRPCVVRYHAFRDEVKAHSQGFPEDIYRVDWVAYLPMPKSWSKAKKEEMSGKLHQSKPDRDNIDKAILDALLSDDSVVATGLIEKRWDDGGGARIEVTAW